MPLSRDVELRFVERPVEIEFGAVRQVRFLQWRKLVRNGPENNWAWGWTDWTDVPMGDEYANASD
jgi:hypothetical protein